MTRKPRALMSVTDKTGIVQFAQKLIKLGWEIISTGGTAKALQDANIPVTRVETVTGFPEMMDGRLKTLHPKVFGGILADRDKPEHLAALQAHGIELIDMVVVNLYNFAGNPSIEQIDVGGPSMIRAAAKNHIHVIVVVDPKDYDWVTQMIVELPMPRIYRQNLATKAFRETMMHDSQICGHFTKCTDSGQLVELGKH